MASSSILDSMRNSSPPRSRPPITKDVLNQKGSSDEIDVPNYEAWMVEYPSALKYFKKIKNNATGKQIIVFLDYDGTLSPIVEDPDSALMTEEMRLAVKNVAKQFPTAIISGRSRDKVQQFVSLKELYYAGSHGMDIVGPQSTDKPGVEVNLYQPPTAAEFIIPLIKEVSRSFVESTKHLQGIKVEDNKFCFSIHYRNVEEKSWEEVAQCAHDILKNYQGRLKLKFRRKVLEVRPVFDWNKGHAVNFLLQTLGMMDRADVLPIYIGDDSTDEDAFKTPVIKNHGCGILVSSIPKLSDASYSLRHTCDVMDFLNHLATLKKGGVP